MFRPPHRLISRANRLVTLTKKALEYSSKTSARHPFSAPSITIARDPGSGGQPIAELVAKKLRFTFYDEALLETIAQSTKKQRAVIEKIDEKRRNAIEDLVHSIINPDYVSDTTYLQHLTRSILAVAETGNAVILGRGANCMIPGTRALHVFVTAPYDVRVQRAVEHEGVSKRKAQSIIAKVSKERQEFVYEYFGQDYNASDSYDLVINTEHLTIEQAAEIIVTAFLQKYQR